MELQLICESYHEMSFSKFDSLACAFQGTVVDILLTIFKSFNSDLVLVGKW